MRRFRKPSKHFLVASLVLFLFACGGGSCGGCAGCGVAPIPGGFPIAERIDNSAQIRLTDAGIGFLESNVATIASTLLGMDLEFHEKLPALFPHADARSWFAGKPEAIRTSAPSKTMLPASGCSVPERILIKVLLPAPLSPISAVTSPASTSKSAPSSATTWP